MRFFFKFRCYRYVYRISTEYAAFTFKYSGWPQAKQFINTQEITITQQLTMDIKSHITKKIARTRVHILFYDAILEWKCYLYKIHSPDLPHILYIIYICSLLVSNSLSYFWKWQGILMLLSPRGPIPRLKDLYNEPFLLPCSQYRFWVLQNHSCPFLSLQRDLGKAWDRNGFSLYTSL